MVELEFQDKIIKLDGKKQDFLKQSLTLLAELDPTILDSRDALVHRITLLIAEIDNQVSQQLSKILFHPEFCQLESTWRGVESLTSLPVNFQRIQVKILDLSWQDLSYSLNTAISLNKTPLYNLIGNRELNTSGGQPFGMLVVDHQISNDLDDDFDDLYTLELLAQLGDLCLAPFILSPSDNFFGESGADWYSDLTRVEKILNGPELVSWQRLRKLTISRFIGLTLPKVALRPAYSLYDVKKIRYQNDEKRNAYLWGSAAFLFASTAIREFNRIGWFGFMKSRWQDQNYGAVINTSKKIMVHIRPNNHNLILE
ncbi:type VI secretion system contractile sheath large subunit [Vibrio sp. SS-MA-C1-2]|uniref:type VI secretion system contractile sheath domain-containing protein n=1 Tax=Vibrio sp. SS-MA-C1-2 TaxID=2908646 RepID=UPI001F451C61|nr:type VI secretion system contractile sheath large subunit [Vibrio sp. SS-MA-C1-2]UJF17202.1 type VI secretion system contractile sheath large subunit [Vibrio sp. SS-MA-C1-2]